MSRATQEQALAATPASGAAPVLYYGTCLPPTAWAAEHDGPVVLQPFHRLVADGGYAEAFPRATRYVYSNPTAVPLDSPRLSSLPLLGVEEQWGIARLDLTQPVARAEAVAAALAALAGDGGRSHGLFVDDLDLHVETLGRTATLHHLQAVLDQARTWWPTRRTGFVLNRGVELWSDAPSVDAVLCEELAPCDVQALPASATAWVHRALLPRLRELRRRGVPAYALTYRDVAAAGFPSAEARMVAEYLTCTVRTTRHLDLWTGAPR